MAAVVVGIPRHEQHRVHPPAAHQLCSTSGWGGWAPDIVGLLGEQLAALEGLVATSFQERDEISHLNTVVGHIHSTYSLAAFLPHPH